jgi:AcrR family transcriptional regulator
METRDRILIAALEVFAETGARGATTRRIAAAAGVNEVTLFRHFGSKEALLREAVDAVGRRVLNERLPEVPADPPAELSRWCRVHLEGMCRAGALLRASMAEHDSQPALTAPACDVPARVADDLHGYLVRMRERGMLGAVDDLRSATSFLMGALFSYAVSRDLMPERYPLAPEAAADHYAGMFLRAVGFRPPGRGDGATPPDEARKR